MPTASDRIRIGLLAGCLGQGGAEKQLLYTAQALSQLGVDLRVYSLTSGEFYEDPLRKIGLQPQWVGRFPSPLFRLSRLACALQRFRPHILQSTHFFTNLYTTVAGRLCGATSIGSLRSDASYGVNKNGRWGSALLRMPPSVITNSFAAKRNAEKLGVEGNRVHVVPNVIDTADFDRQASLRHAGPLPEGRLVFAVSNLIRVKRVDRFLTALEIARRRVGDLKGIIIGDGPERAALESRANELGLSPDAVHFLGRRDDVPALLSRAHMLVLTSDYEGFPNVILEAMAARLPVISTAAGDTAVVVQNGITGYVVEADVDSLADRIVKVAESDELRARMGEAGRERLEQQYDFRQLSNQLVSVYRDIARQQNNSRLLAQLH